MILIGMQWVHESDANSKFKNDHYTLTLDIWDYVIDLPDSENFSDIEPD